MPLLLNMLISLWALSLKSSLYLWLITSFYVLRSGGSSLTFECFGGSFLRVAAMNVALTGVNLAKLTKLAFFAAFPFSVGLLVRGPVTIKSLGRCS